MRRFLAPALCGLLAAGAGVAAAELLAAAARPTGAPVTAIGGALIDAAPTPVKEFAVRTFGTHDKPLLLTGIAIGLAAFAAVVGIMAARRRVYGIAGAAVLGVAGALAAATRPGGSTVDVLPTVAGAVIAGSILLCLLRPRPSVAAPSPSPSPSPSRREFVIRAVAVAGVAALAGGGSQVVRRVRGRAAARSRESVVLPPPADRARPLPAGTPAGFHTRNADFYRVDTALAVPRVDAGTWRLRIHGMVDRPVELSFDELLRRPLVERDITMTCVSNEVGGPYLGTARWLGVPLAPLLREAGVRSGADQVVARSTEGMTIGTPVGTVLDGRDAMLAVGMNGEPLPLEHGFPVRMVTPGVYGYAGSCKWLAELELSTFDAFDAYWVKRGWAKEAPIKTASRIDRPKPFARVESGKPVTVAGVAWAQHRGVARVEISVDGGPWTAAEILPISTVDTWVQWRYSWRPTPGGHSIRVRATDQTGDVQTDERVTPFPNGATGLHTIAITAA